MQIVINQSVYINCIKLNRKTFQVKCEQRQVFQSKKVRNSITMREIEELRITSCHMSLRNKKELFYSNGVDYDKVFKYYDYVKSLNSIYYESILESKNKQNLKFLEILKLLKIYLSILFENS